jgi:hypothetical protein
MRDGSPRPRAQSRTFKALVRRGDAGAWSPGLAGARMGYVADATLRPSELAGAGPRPRTRARQVTHGFTSTELLNRSPLSGAGTLRLVLNDEVRRGRVDY